MFRSKHALDTVPIDMMHPEVQLPCPYCSKETQPRRFFIHLKVCVGTTAKGMVKAALNHELFDLYLLIQRGHFSDITTMTTSSIFAASASRREGHGYPNALHTLKSTLSNAAKPNVTLLSLGGVFYNRIGYRRRPFYGRTT